MSDCPRASGAYHDALCDDVYNSISISEEVVGSESNVAVHLNLEVYGLVVIDVTLHERVGPGRNKRAARRPGG